MALTAARRAEMLHSIPGYSEASKCALVVGRQCKGDCLVNMKHLSEEQTVVLPKPCSSNVAIAGVRGLLELAGSATSTQRVASVEGLPCCTGLLDGPAALIASILTCGPSSDAGSAALQAGQNTYTMWNGSDPVCCDSSIS